MILHYLLAISDLRDPRSEEARSPLALKRRQSLILLTQTVKDDDRFNPSLFNLVDLILSSTESHNPQTIVACMRLIAILLHKNHGYVVGTLLRVSTVREKQPQRTVGALDAEMESYLSVAASVGGEAGMDRSYEEHLSDMQALLEIHPCSQEYLTSILTSPVDNSFSSVSIKPVPPHHLNRDDPLFKRLMNLFSHFLTNGVETNLSLTEAVVTLASCCQLRLEGWMCVEPLRYQFDDEDPYESPSLANEDAALRSLHKARRVPHWRPDSNPLLLSTLNKLQSQVEQLRNHIDDLDTHIQNRKQAFRVHDEISEALASQPQVMQTPRANHRGSVELPPGSWTPQIPRHVLESSTPSSSQHSRAHSPRGRRETQTPPVSMPNLEPPIRFNPTSSPSRSSGLRSEALSSSSLSSSPQGRSGVASSRRMSPSVGVERRNIRQPRPMTLMADVTGNIAAVADAETLKRRVRFTYQRKDNEEKVDLEVFEKFWDGHGEEEGGGRNRASREDGEQEDIITKEASLNHVLTNVVMLQEFVLQIVAIMQLRASLFEEVRFAVE
jgi:hypothetical protein